MATTMRRDPSQADVDEASSTLRACVDRDLLAEICSYGNRRTSTPSPLILASSPWKDEPLHKCRPWSEADFFYRLRTFTPQRWFGKSLVVAPPRCAAQGWVNSGVDMLECEMCHATLTLTTNTEPAPDMLSSSHSTTCPWTQQACEADVSHFPLVTAECLLTHTARHSGGCRRLLRAYNGDLTVEAPEELASLLAGVRVQEGGVGEGRDSIGSLTLEALARRVEECSQDGATGDAEGGSGGGAVEEKDDENGMEDKKGALILALYGWEAVPPPQPSQQQQQQQRLHCAGGREGGGGGGGWSLACGMCGRRVSAGRVVDRRSSLGSGRVMEGGREGGQEGARTKARRVGGGEQGTQGPAAFDVLSQHRWWCAWVSRGLDEKGQPGWRQTLKALVGRMRRVVELGGLMEEEEGGVSSYKVAKRLLESM